MFFDYGEPKKQWIAYDNGSYEPVDPQGDLRKKPRDDRKLDWWVEDKKPDWRPETYADTKRGRKARQELGGTRTMEQKPKPFLSEKPESAPAETLLVQPQHRNTGHAAARLGGLEDGKVTMLGSSAQPKAPAAKPHPQPTGSLARAEANSKRPNFARDTAGLMDAEKKLNRHDAGRDARGLLGAEGAAKDKMKGLTFAGYLDDKPVYYGRTEGVLYDDNGIPATEDGLEKPLVDPVDMAALGGLAAKGYIKGVEIPLTIGKRKFRFAPFGNRTGKKLNERPHYHRNVPDPNNPGESIEGQGIGRHRPWEIKDGDKSWKDRF